MKKNKKAVFKWLFVIAIIAVIIYTFRDSAAPIAEELLATSSWVLLGLCIMSIAYLLVEGYITMLLAKLYNPEFKFWHGVGNACFCSFYRVATLGSGAGVAAIIYLNEKGVHYSKGFGMYMLQYAFHKVSIAIYSAIFCVATLGYMVTHYEKYIGLLLAGYAVTMVITIGLILFCCSTGFHKSILRMLQFFNKKGKYDALDMQLRSQCAELEEASQYILEKKKLVIEVVFLNMIKMAFWCGMPYLTFMSLGTINMVQTMAITALVLMLAAVIPAPAGIGSTEFMFATLFGPILGMGLAGSASLLFRFATFVFPFLLGAVVVVARQIRLKQASVNL